MFALLTNTFCSPVGREGHGTDMKRCHMIVLCLLAVDVCATAL